LKNSINKEIFMSSSSNINYIAENAVIGSLLIDNNAFDEICYLQPDDFGSHIHRDAYSAIHSLINEGKNADIISVSDSISKEKNNNNIFVEIASIANSTFTPKNIKYYAELVKQSSDDRKLISLAQEITTNVWHKKDNRLDLAQKKLSEITDSTHSDIAHVSEVLKVVIQKIDDRQKNPSDITGLSTGFIDIDKLTYGLHPGHLIILAARPGMGKTLLGMNIAEHVAIHENKPVIIFSLEMNKEELIERSFASIGRIEGDLIKTGRLSQKDWEKVSLLVGNYAQSNLFLEDCSGLRIADIRAKCRRIKRNHGLSLIIVDYLTLVSGDGENETDRVGKISRAFKLLARDLNIPVLVISQLNRGLENRQDKRPTMSDLRQSGAIEQDADLIMFIYRDEIYNKESYHKGIAELNIAKNRHGSLGTAYLAFNGKYCRFDNYTGVVSSSYETAVKKHYYDA